MDKKKILIVTGTGGILGTGHIQRMLNLAVELNQKNNFCTSILLKRNEYPLPEKLATLITRSIPSDTDLIIRDMRDSSVEEILLLKKNAPVLAIDDSGEGKKTADYSLSLLPVPSDNLQDNKPDTSLFLYGYNFSQGIRNLEKKSLTRDIDVAVYAGYNPSPEIVASVKKSIPQTACSVLLEGGKAHNLTGKILSPYIEYTEVISRAKIVITHFGLTMFEAHACGCSIAALNPSSYHSSLTDIVRNDFDIICSLEYDSFSPDSLSKIIQTRLNNYIATDSSVPAIINRINSGTENFINHISTLINNL